jgi:hypothetical protein
MSTQPSSDTGNFTLDRGDLKSVFVLALLGALISVIFAMAGAVVSLIYLVLFGLAAAGLCVIALNCLRGLKP